MGQIAQIPQPPTQSNLYPADPPPPMNPARQDVSYREGRWSDPASGQPLSYRLWQPSSPRAFLLIIHGFGEHGGRYASMGHTLAAEGICVAAPDLCGHGRSSGRRGDVGDVACCAKQVGLLADHAFGSQAGDAPRAYGPGGPEARYTVFGHSFGGLVAIALALQQPATLCRLVLQSPFLEAGFPLPRWKTSAAMLLARWWPTCSFSMNLDAAMLSHDPDVVQAYRADPLVHNRMSARSYRSILQASDDAFRRAHELQVPLLMLNGDADRIASVEAARRWFALVPGKKRSTTFPGAYHELHHEPIRDEALRLLCDWTLAYA